LDLPPLSVTIEPNRNREGLYVAYGRATLKRTEDNSAVRIKTPRLTGRSPELAISRVHTWYAVNYDKLLDKVNISDSNISYLESWFEYCKLNKWEGTTQDTNTANFNHIKNDEEFCSIPLKNVKAKDLLGFFSRIRRVDGRAGNTASIQRKVKQLLTSAYNRAVVLEKIPSNPMNLLPKDALPKVKPSQAKEIEPEHERTLIKYLENNDSEIFWRALVMVGIDAGCGPAELFGLRYEHFKPPYLLIMQNVVTPRNTGKTISKRPKADSRRRNALLNPKTVLALETLLKAGKSPSGYIFTTLDGEAWTYEPFAYAWHQLCKRAGIPRYRVYALRHSTASAALRAGASPAAVMKRMGHSRLSTTLNTYAHALPNEADTVAQFNLDRWSQ
jgi:integrase